VAVALAVSILAHGAAIANADEGADRAEARRHFESGLAHFNLREYRQAVDDFQAAYRLRPDPVFLYNLAQSFRLANDPEQALYFYRAYLRTSEDAPNRHEVEERIAVLEKLMADKQKMATPPDQTLAPTNKPVSPPSPPPAAAAASSSVPSPVEDRGLARTPVYKKWWLWTVVGVVVVGTAVGVGLGIGLEKPATFNASVGTVGPGAALSIVRW
jgi:tetratricopeptide (TPR) repeat protein